MARSLKSVTRRTVNEQPRQQRYELRLEPDSPVQASMRTQYDTTYARWDAKLDVPSGESMSQYRTSVLATNVAADAAAAGVKAVVIQPQRVPIAALNKRNKAEFKRLTESLKELDYGYCLGGKQRDGSCESWYMPTTKPDGTPLHNKSSTFAVVESEPVQAELAPAEPAFGPPETAPTKKRPVKRAAPDITKEKQQHDFTEALKKANDSKGKRCKILAREKGYSISECNRGFTFTARDKAGEEIGRLDLSQTGEDRYKVSWSGTDEKTRGERVGTALYEAAAEACCKRGWTLTSDHMRSRYSEAFWAKQERKGRASCNDGSEGGMSRGQAFDYVYENYLDEARTEYIDNNNLEDDVVEAYFEANNPGELMEAQNEYISRNNLEDEAQRIYFGDDYDNAISEYVDNHESELELEDEDSGGPGEYYATPWENTRQAFQARIADAETWEEAEKLREELARLDEKLPDTDDGDWPCRNYSLDPGVCQGDEIDLGKLPRRMQLGGLGKQSERRAFAKEFGKQCFLKERVASGGGRSFSYPVCTTSGKYDCLSIRSAYRKAKGAGDTKTANKAKRLASKSGCDWAKKKPKPKKRSRKR